MPAETKGITESGIYLRSIRQGFSCMRAAGNYDSHITVILSFSEESSDCTAKTRHYRNLHAAIDSVLIARSRWG